MKHKNLLALLGAALLVQTSCNKPPFINDPRDGNAVFDDCRVAKTTNGALTRQFSYNSDNDPVSVQSSFVGTGSPNLIFKYNKKGQLIEYTGIYSNGNFEFLHRYEYNNGRVSVDTFYALGAYSNPAGSFSKRYSYVKYDNLNRIVQDSEVYAFPATSTNVIHYQYDANGNLITGDPYDNKLNPHRTNKVWMLIDRNYSLNNPVAADTYNSSGLPLTLNSGGKFSLLMIFGYFYYYNSMTITYDCQ